MGALGKLVCKCGNTHNKYGGCLKVDGTFICEVCIKERKNKNGSGKVIEIDKEVLQTIVDKIKMCSGSKNFVLIVQDEKIDFYDFE